MRTKWVPILSRLFALPTSTQTVFNPEKLKRGFTVAQVRKAAIFRKGPKEHNIFSCHLCDDSWYKGEEHHTRCLLSEMKVRE